MLLVRKYHGYTLNKFLTDLIDGNVVFEDKVCMMLCGKWAFWTERYTVWHGDGGRSVLQSVCRATKTAMDFRLVGKHKIPKCDGVWAKDRKSVV